MEDNITDNNDLRKNYVPSKSRFYILFGFSVYSFVYGFIWNSWEPIMIPFTKIYKWTLTDINLLVNVNTIVFCIFIAPFVLFWNKFGIKLSYYLSSLCVLIGSFMRIYPGSVYVQSILIMVGNSVTAFGNLITAIGITAISAIWFPSHERTRSTTTALSFGSLGSAIAPIVATYMVPNIRNISENSSTTEVALIERNIASFMYVHCALSIFTVFLIMVYFPSKPSIMPCKSSDSLIRIDLISGCKSLIRNSQFALVFVMNLIGSGINSGVFTVLTPTIIPLGISQDDAALIKGVSTLTIFFSTLLSGWLCDRFGYRLVVFSTVPPTIIMSVIYGLQTYDVINHGLVSIYVVIGILSFVSAIIGPISYEMGCDAAFPVGEEVSSAVICMASNIGTMCFLFITMIPGIGTRWIPLAYAGSSVLLFPIIYLYRGDRKRLVYDSGVASAPIQVDQYTRINDQ